MEHTKSHRFALLPFIYPWTVALDVRSTQRSCVLSPQNRTIAGVSTQFAAAEAGPRWGNLSFQTRRRRGFQRASVAILARETCAIV